VKNYSVQVITGTSLNLIEHYSEVRSFYAILVQNTEQQVKGTYLSLIERLSEQLLRYILGKLKH
jgi:hypothetical protein